MTVEMVRSNEVVVALRASDQLTQWGPVMDQVRSFLHTQARAAYLFRTSHQLEVWELSAMWLERQRAQAGQPDPDRVAAVGPPHLRLWGVVFGRSLLHSQLRPFSVEELPDALQWIGGRSPLAAR